MSFCPRTETGPFNLANVGQTSNANNFFDDKLELVHYFINEEQEERKWEKVYQPSLIILFTAFPVKDIICDRTFFVAKKSTKQRSIMLLTIEAINMGNQISVLFKVSLMKSTPASWLSSLLLLCGDVELNPGPKPAREPKPDKAKIMADKVDAHDAKLEELEALVKSQAELIEALSKKQVDLVAQLEEKQVELRKHLEANKVEAETSIVQLKVALESDLRRTSSNLEVKIDDQKVMPHKGSLLDNTF